MCAALSAPYGKPAQHYQLGAVLLSPASTSTCSMLVFLAIIVLCADILCADITSPTPTAPNTSSGCDGVEGESRREGEWNRLILPYKDKKLDDVRLGR